MEQEVKNCNNDNMKLTTNTVVGLTFGQIITLVTYTALVVILYADIISRLDKVEAKQSTFESVCNKQDAINEKLTNSIVNIEKSLISIEGKLDLKQNRY